MFTKSQCFLKIAFFFFIFFFFSKDVLADKPTFLIIHELRGGEKCCSPGSVDLVKNLKKRKDIDNLSYSWALRFDVLEDNSYSDYLKNLDNLGLLLEVTPSLASSSGVLYKGRVDGSNWYYAKNAFLIGYTRDERKKIIDHLFSTFKNKLGFYPAFTVSWMIDSWSLDYLNKTYGVSLHELTKEQYETDSYTLYGGVFNAPYYPSLRHPLIPAKKGQKLDLVMVRQTISDILRNYGSSKAYYTSQPNDYLENPERKDTSYFVSLIEDVINQPTDIKFGVLGFENSYSWQEYGDEYLRQLKYISEKERKGELEVVSPRDYASLFKNTYPENPSFYFVKDFTPEEKLGVLWYFGKTYRARVILKEGKVLLDDLRIYTPIDDPYYIQPSRADNSYLIVPYILDGSLMFEDKEKKRVVAGNTVSDINTSPLGIILAEGYFNVKPLKQTVEIEFTDKVYGGVKFLPEAIEIDKSLNPSFSQPYPYQIDNFFGSGKETNLSFLGHFDFIIKDRKKTSGDSTLDIGWKRNGTFIPLANIQKLPDKFILRPLMKVEDIHLLDPMFQPDRSDLPADSIATILYWNNKTAIAGRNPVRLFVLPLNRLKRPVQITDIKVNMETKKALDIVFPEDYSYRVRPWFIDINSSVPVKTKINIVIDEEVIAKNVEIEFVVDCRKNIKSCLKSQAQLLKYILVLLAEQKMRLVQWFKSPD